MPEIKLSKLMLLSFKFIRTCRQSLQQITKIFFKYMNVNVTFEATKQFNKALIFYVHAAKISINLIITAICVTKYATRDICISRQNSFHCSTLGELIRFVAFNNMLIQKYILKVIRYISDFF